MEGLFNLICFISNSSVKNASVIPLVLGTQQTRAFVTKTQENAIAKTAKYQDFIVIDVQKDMMVNFQIAKEYNKAIFFYQYNDSLLWINLF